MKIAPLTKDEQARLEALYDYDVLDTNAEKVFDDLTVLASEICNTPIALISLVDPDRQWFKSKVGLDADETSRDIAFCAHAIHQKEVFEVKDTLKDHRFFDNPLVTADPKIRFYAGAPLITPDGHAIGTLCAISDKPKELSEHQRNALEILSREVISQLELRQKVKLLAQANQRKTDYLSTISHELRTPLNAIVSYSNILIEEKESTNLSSKQVQYMQSIEFSGKRLLDLVNSVLDIHKIEEGKMELHLSAVNTALFIQSINAITHIKAQQKKVDFSITVSSSVPETIKTDDAKLGQILINLINNSIKFTPSGKSVNLSVECAAEKLIFVVKDQGRGISSEDQKKLFNKYQQVGDLRNTEGTGLGLVITKGLAELLGGELKLLSSEAAGTLVKVTIPLMRSAQAVSPPRLDQHATSYNLNASILVVEDNEINQHVAEAVFGRLDLKIELACTGEEAVEKANKKTFDIIFMDIHLPGISGFEATNLIKQSNPDAAVIALTADAFFNPENNQNSVRFDTTLTKPIDKSKLIEVLNRFIPQGR